MKTVLTAMMLAGFGGTALAALDIPKWVHKSDNVKEAAALAKEEGKALAFVLTDPGSS